MTLSSRQLCDEDWGRLCDGWQLSQQVRAAILEQRPTHIVGADEVGWGSWAGPIEVCAVLAPVTWHLEGLRDSKKLSPKRREKLNEVLRADPDIKFYISTIENTIIDSYGATRALNLAFQMSIRSALSDIHDIPVEGIMVLTDGNRRIPRIEHYSLIKGDDKVPAISAASVLAKVDRDETMAQYSVRYPGYGWENNSGYCSPEHLDGLSKLGTSPLHRMSYAPMSEGKYAQATNL
jgi:ribonuclease HII